jgi:hypothetical protein
MRMSAGVGDHKQQPTNGLLLQGQSSYDGLNILLLILHGTVLLLKCKKNNEIF